jgi:hypothetical protein
MNRYTGKDKEFIMRRGVPALFMSWGGFALVVGSVIYLLSTYGWHAALAAITIYAGAALMMEASRRMRIIRKLVGDE